MNTKTFLASAAALALLVSPLVAQPVKNPSKKGSDAAQVFVNKAGVGGMFEVETSRLALDKARREDVKDFAQKMVTDHGQANEELKTVADQIGTKVPEKMDPSHQAKFNKLKSATGPGFDTAYINAQTEAHREAVTLFDRYAKAGDNAELKAFASKTLPVLQGHEAHVKELKTSSSGATGASPGTSGKSK